MSDILRISPGMQRSYISSADIDSVEILIMVEVR